MQKVKIGIWGPSGVGKTTLLAGTLLAIRKDKKDWRWGISTSGDFDTTFQFIEDSIVKLKSKEFPENTAAVGKPPQFVLDLEERFSSLGARGRCFELTLMDVAGGFTEDVTDTEEYFERLSQCDGILMIVDPNLKEIFSSPTAERATKSYMALFDLLSFQLNKQRGSTGTLEMPVSICLTKMDGQDHWAHKDRPRQYLEALMGRATFNQMEGIFSHINYFSVSVAGRYEDPVTGEEVPNTEIIHTPEQDRLVIKDFNNWTPLNVLDPLYWLLQQVENKRNRELGWVRSIVRQMLRKPIYPFT